MKRHGFCRTADGWRGIQLKDLRDSGVDWGGKLLPGCQLMVDASPWKQAVGYLSYWVGSGLMAAVTDLI